MTDTSSTTGVLIGSLAFLAGAFTTVATLFVYKKKQEEPLLTGSRYEGWEESLGV